MVCHAMPWRSSLRRTSAALGVSGQRPAVRSDDVVLESEMTQLTYVDANRLPWQARAGRAHNEHRWQGDPPAKS